MNERLGNYEVLSELGRGGMAKALLAQNDQGIQVVLKVPLTRDDETLERLRNEARAGIRFNHPHLVQTLDMFEVDRVPILVVEYIDGVCIDDLTETGPLPAAAVARLGWQIAEALNAIHTATDERGNLLHMLHRDVSCGNVLVDRNGDARLIDLGIVLSTEFERKTQTGMLRGTLPYLAPELFGDGDYAVATDLWALGCVLFEAAAAARLFTGNHAQVVSSILLANPQGHKGWQKVDEKIRPTVLSLLARAPRHRPESADTVAKALRMLEEGLGGTGGEVLSQRVGAILDGDYPDTLSGPFFPEDDHADLEDDLKSLIDDLRAIPEPSTDGPTSALRGIVPEVVGDLPDFDMDAPVFGGTNSVIGAPQAADPFAPKVPARPLIAPIDDVPPSDGALPVGGPNPAPSLELATGPRDPAGNAPSAHQRQHGMDLDLERYQEVREARRRSSLHNAEADWQTKVDVEPPGRKTTSTIGKVLVAMALVGVGYLGYTRYQVAQLERERKARFEEEQEATKRLYKRLEAPKNAPACFSGNHGWFFVYEKNGENVIVERIEEVPSRLRRRARCVPKQ